MTDEFARTEGARDETIREISERANADKICPFCVLDPKNELLFQTEHWKAFHNLSPYAGTKWHIMLVSTKHVLDFNQISIAGLVNFLQCLQRLKEQFGFDGGSLLCRFGTPGYNAATIYHLHAHVIVSDAKPVDVGAIDPRIRKMYEYAYAQAPEGTDPLEWIDEVWQGLDVLRTADKGKAWPIRAKLSDKVAHR